MSTRNPIAVESLILQPFTTLEPDGVLLVSGTGVDNVNLMTISWGMFGIMWNRPIVMVMVRPTRHTWAFIKNSPDFTVNWLDASLSEALDFCGHQSGRDIDKFAGSGLHAEAATKVQSPLVAESVLTLECRTLYHDNLQPEHFIDARLHQYYGSGDYHGLFFGEIMAASGIDQYRSSR